jgi:hypothetical protein
MKEVGRWYFGAELQGSGGEALRLPLSGGWWPLLSRMAGPIMTARAPVKHQPLSPWLRQNITIRCEISETCAIGGWKSFRGILIETLGSDLRNVFGQ